MSAKHIACGLVALLSALAGITLAVHHPLWPLGLLALMACVAVLEGAVPGAWLWLLPASLPLMNFSPWTGWIAFEELDLLLLAVLAGAYGRMAWTGAAQGQATDDTRQRRRLLVLLVALALSGLLSLVRGVLDAGGWAFDWFGAYTQAVNSLRVFKSLGFALLLWPLLEQQLRTDAPRAERRFALGMALGLAWVCAAVLWERAAFAGLWDFSSSYRTVATFWEMHVGGAAIDGYLAMATPFAVLALVSARRPMWWLPCALLTLLATYACLTTFSRGVYLALAVQIVLLAFVQLRHSRYAAQPWARWRVGGLLLVAVLLLLEVFAVLGDDDSYMNQRLASARLDTGHRLAHWHAGLGLLRSPMDWWAGMGLGRLPANYAARVPGEGFSGSVELQAEPGADGSVHRFVALRVPANLDDLMGSYALTQRVELSGNGGYVLQIDVRSQTPADLAVLLCQRHLLYDGVCQGATVAVAASTGAWQSVRLPLRGPWLGAGSRPIALAVSVATPGAAVDVARLQVFNGLRQALLQNGDFSQGLASWFPAAQSYFVPWHIDNLYLETLIERGWLGVLALGALIAWAMASFLLAPFARGLEVAAMAAGLLGVLVVGLVSSVQDVPRVALLFYLLPLFLLGKRAQRQDFIK